MKQSTRSLAQTQQFVGDLAALVLGLQHRTARMERVIKAQQIRIRTLQDVVLELQQKHASKEKP